MSSGEGFGGQIYRQDLSESEKEILSEGLRAFALLINEQVACPAPETSGSGDGSVPAMDADEFWDTYGANIVRFCNYMEYGRWRPEDGLDIFEPGMVSTPNGLEPAFVRRKATRWRPPVR